jgi:hypothetical protein
MFVLDTNVVSELRKAKAGKADKHVTAWARRVPPGALFLSAITILELEAGVLLIERVILRRRPFSGPGWTAMSCPRSPVAFWLSIPPWRSAAPDFMCPISPPAAMH